MEFPHSGFIPGCHFSFNSSTTKKLFDLGVSSASITNLRGMGHERMVDNNTFRAKEFIIIGYPDYGSYPN